MYLKNDKKVDTVMALDLIRIGIIGAGQNTQSRHIPGLQALNAVEITSVCNRSRMSAEKVAKKFRIAKIYDNWIDLVQDPDIDAIVIGTYPDMHCRLVCAGLQANKHVLCEARMAMNAAEAHKMLEMSRARPHLVAQIVPAPFTLGVDSTVKRIIEEGFIGDILAVYVRDGNSFLNSEAPFLWRMDFAKSGYNVMTLGIWYESIVRWIGEATRVTAMGKTFIKTRKDDHGVLHPVQIPEHMDVIAEMACGAQAHLQISQVTGLMGPAEVYLYGSAGTLRISENKLYGGQKASLKLAEIPVPQELQGGWRVEEEFIHAIRGKEDVVLTDFETAVKYMEFTEAVAISMAEGKTVALPLVARSDR
jgi:predicted dehydrogenase